MIKIPTYAKQSAKTALKWNKDMPKSKRVGLNKNQASKLGINSGIERAKQLINSNYISESDGRSIGRFYSRFKNCRTIRCEMAINLWGGRQFGKEMYTKFFK